jgi:hypothetical protein
MNLTQNMMEMLRGRYGLDRYDTSKDVHFRKMGPVDIVRECTEWKLGDPSWANVIAGWMKAAGAKPQDF